MKKVQSATSQRARVGEELPDDIATPITDRRERASFIANSIIGGVLFTLCLGMLMYVAFGNIW